MTENPSVFSGFWSVKDTKPKQIMPAGGKMASVKVSFLWVIEVIIGYEQVCIDIPTGQEEFIILRGNQHG